MTPARRAYFDARSAALDRNTGWERYTRGLASILINEPNVYVHSQVRTSRPAQVWADVVETPVAARGFALRHFPSLPPVVLGRDGPTVVTIHDLTWWRFPESASPLGLRYYKPLMERAARRADRLVTVTNAMRAELEEQFPGAEVRVVSPFVAPNFSCDSGAAVERSGKPYFIAIGSVEPRKNLQTLATAFLNSDLADSAELIIVGRQAWGSVPVGVTFVGAVSDRRLKELLGGALALVAPSTYEGFGLPVAEAQAMGVPVLCSEIPAFVEVTAGEARYFDPTDVDGLADQLRDVAAGNGSAHSQGGTRYTPEATKRQLRGLYAELGFDLFAGENNS